MAQRSIHPDWYGSNYWGRTTETQDFMYVGGVAYCKWMGPVRTRDDYPYGYSYFVLHGEHRRVDQDVGVIWLWDDDRMRSHDHDAWIRAWEPFKKRGINAFSRMSLDDVSQFLTRYRNKKTECVWVLECCNQSNGYPVYSFYIKDE